MRNLRKFVGPVGITILLVGVGCFVVQWFFGFARGSINPRGLNWPVHPTSQAIRLPDGRYAIATDGIGRIQIYSPSRQFLYGWQTDSVENVLRLRPDGTLDDYTELSTTRSSHRWKERIYDANGVLLATGHSDRHLNELPGERPAPITVPHTLPSWLVFPLYGPFYAWSVALVGLVLTAVTTPPELLRGARRKLMYLPQAPIHPPA
ncbi:MAG TPA: hypothetical protein VGI81_02030 [Tepidisphaeraceae bacterium]|jgi:hypothetical protein